MHIIFATLLLLNLHAHGTDYTKPKSVIKAFLDNPQGHKIPLEFRKLKNVDFRDKNLEKANFRGFKLTNCLFSNANLESAKFSTVILKTAKNVVSKPSETIPKINKVIGQTVIKNCNFDNTNLESASFFSTYLNDVSFTKSILKKATFMGAELREVDFFEAKHQEIDLKGAWFYSAKLIWTEELEKQIKNDSFLPGTICWVGYPSPKAKEENRKGSLGGSLHRQVSQEQKLEHVQNKDTKKDTLKEKFLKQYAAQSGQGSKKSSSMHSIGLSSSRRKIVSVIGMFEQQPEITSVSEEP